MHEVLLFLALFLAGPLLVIVGIAFVLHFFIALEATPSRRAGWTAGIAYLLATILFLFGGNLRPEQQIWVPLVCLPSALIVFLFWRNDFRRRWIENPDLLPEGMTIANDDWRIGLAEVLAFTVAMTGLAVIRTYL